MTDRHSYPEPDEEEGFLYVREYEDHRLVEEYRFLVDLLQVVAGEIAFRADHPEQRDDTGEIYAEDTKFYELSDELRTWANPNRTVLPEERRD